MTYLITTLLFEELNMSKKPQGTWSVHVVLAFAFATLPASVANAGYAEQLLDRESDYIVDCSYTQWARNKSTHNPDADAYGCFNNVRLGSDAGPDWVITSENAIGIIGLMKATRVF